MDIYISDIVSELCCFGKLSDVMIAYFLTSLNVFLNYLYGFFCKH